MRIYSAASEEAVHARDVLKDWAGEGFLTEAQYRQMEQETPCDLRRTNIFLRLVLGLFTAVIVFAVVGLVYALVLEGAGSTTLGIFLLISAGGSYAAAEFAVSEHRLYRYGIEEALAICAGCLLCAGLAGLFSSDGSNSIIPVAGVAASIWIWHRFGLPYAPLAAMLFVPWLASEWTDTRMGMHVLVAVLYVGGLTRVRVMRPQYRSTYLDREYSIAEALLWLGIYVALNLQLAPVELFGFWFRGGAGVNDFPRAFYWSTFVLTWCLPPVVLMLGLRTKDRLVIAVGVITAILTLATNKSYLGWERHTWDPMLLGALLIGVVLLVRRWLAAGDDEVRRGFTARRLSGKDKRWMSVGAVAVGVVSPEIIPQGPQTSDPQFGGGASGGGGASSDF